MTSGIIPSHKQTESTHHRLFELVKTALFKFFVSPYATVCDLYCGRVTDEEKWDEAQIGHYIGIDVAASGVDEIREAWESQRKSYTSQFFVLDPSIENIELKSEDKENMADIVCCMQHLQFCFDTEERVRRLLHNVSTLLKPGGYFFGITPDSSTIWAKYQKNVEAYHNKSTGMKPNIVPNCIRTESYMITFEVEEEKFPFFGKKYLLKFANDISAESHCLVHFPSLIRLQVVCSRKFNGLEGARMLLSNHGYPNLLEHSTYPMGTCPPPLCRTLQQRSVHRANPSISSDGYPMALARFDRVNSPLLWLSTYH